MKTSKTIYQLFLLLTSICILLLFSGCSLINLDKTEPEKTFFTFNELQNTKPEKMCQKLTDRLTLMEFTATSEFRGNQFIYKIKNNYIKDYYNRFFSPPEKAIQIQCAKWLNIIKSQGSHPDLILKGDVLEIYCDRTDKIAPLAIIKIRFSLIDYNKTDKPILEKDLFSGVKLNNFTPENLITAWTTCLEKIFESLESEISSII